MFGANLAYALLIAAIVHSCNAKPMAEPSPRPPPPTCEYIIKPGAALALAYFPVRGDYRPSLAACRTACTEDPYCGNVEFRPPHNSTDTNCSFYQQVYYEPFPTRSAPDSHFVLSIKQGSCGKSTATRKPLKCKPGIATFKGTDCKYKVTCGVTLPLNDTGIKGRQDSVYRAQVRSLKAGLNVDKFPGSQQGESLSYSEGGFLIERYSPFYDRTPTMPNKHGLVYQIVKNSCNVKAATPKSGMPSTRGGEIVQRLVEN